MNDDDQEQLTVSPEERAAAITAKIRQYDVMTSGDVPRMRAYMMAGTGNDFDTNPALIEKMSDEEILSSKESWDTEFKEEGITNKEELERFLTSDKVDIYKKKPTRIALDGKGPKSALLFESNFVDGEWR